MTEVKGLETLALTKKDAPFIWVSCRGERCLIPFRSLRRIQLAKQMYELSEGKEEPYLDLPLTEFHEILTILRDDNRVMQEFVVVQYFVEESSKNISSRQVKFCNHFNYLLIDDKEIGDIRNKEKERIAKLKDDIKNNRIVRSKICPKLKKCDNELCLMAHRPKEFQPEKCEESFRIRWCNEQCESCGKHKSPASATRNDEKRIARDCTCKCREMLHRDENQDPIDLFHKAARKYR